MDYLYLPKVDLHVYLNMQVKSGELTRLSHKANIWSQWHSIKGYDRTDTQHECSDLRILHYLLCPDNLIFSQHACAL